MHKYTFCRETKQYCVGLVDGVEIFLVEAWVKATVCGFGTQTERKLQDDQMKVHKKNNNNKIANIILRIMLPNRDV